MTVRGTASRSTLLYRATCPHCRLLARIAVLLSLGTIARRPLDSREAQDLYARHPDSRGRLALVHGPAIYTGARTLTGAVLVVLSTLGGRVRRVLARGRR